MGWIFTFRKISWNGIRIMRAYILIYMLYGYRLQSVRERALRSISDWTCFAEMDSRYSCVCSQVIFDKMGQGLFLFYHNNVLCQQYIIEGIFELCSNCTCVRR